MRLLDRGFFRIGSRGLRRGERDLRPGDDAKAARHASTATRSSSTTRRRAASAAVAGRRGPLDRPGWSRRSGRRRGGGHELLAYRNGSSGATSSSAEINDYLKETIGEDHSAKDFRTWNATVLAAVVLAASARERDLSTKGGAQARRNATRSSRSLAISATRRPSAAPPTSTRGSSTASTAASPSAESSSGCREDPAGLAGGPGADREGRARPHRPARVRRDRARGLNTSAGSHPRTETGNDTAKPDLAPPLLAGLFASAVLLTVSRADADIGVIGVKPNVGAPGQLINLAVGCGGPRCPPQLPVSLLPSGEARRTLGPVCEGKHGPCRSPTAPRLPQEPPYVFLGWGSRRSAPAFARAELRAPIPRPEGEAGCLRVRRLLRRLFPGPERQPDHHLHWPQQPQIPASPLRAALYVQ